MQLESHILHALKSIKKTKYFTKDLNSSLIILFN